MDHPIPTPPPERRSEYRRPLRTRVTLAFPERRPMEGRAFDVGAGGLGVVSDVNLPIGATCAVSFSLLFNDGSIFAGKTNAKVAYSVLSRAHDGFKVGLQFINLPEAANAAVTRYLDA